MSMTRNRGQRRRGLIIASIIALFMAMILPAALRADLSPGSADTSGRTSFTGRFLVAVPSMPPPFAHAVVLMVKHSRDGALGLVINQPLDERPIAPLIATLGGDALGTTGKVRVFRGGPVESDVGFALHSPEYRRPETLDIDSHVALSDAAAVLRDIGLGKGPKQMPDRIRLFGLGAGATRSRARTRLLAHRGRRSGALVRR